MKKYFVVLLLLTTLLLVPNIKATENEDKGSEKDIKIIEKVIPNDLPTPISGHKLIDGIDSVPIYIDSAGTPRASYWQRLIKEAVNNWMYTGVGANRFFGSYVTSASSSKIEVQAVYKGYFLEDAETVHAATALIYNNHSVNPVSSDWSHAVILLNDDVLRRPSISDDEAIGDMIHEFGHAFGLMHNNINPYSIMHSFSVINTKGEKIYRVAQRVQKVDNDALIRIYGNIGIYG